MNPIDQLKAVLCDPTGRCCIDGSDEDRAIVDRALQALAQPEPVALKMVYGEVCYQSNHDDQSFGMWCPITEREFPNGTPFYTAPPRKTWVRLTSNEVWDVYEEDNYDALQYARAIEAKLKEKNT